MNTIQPIPHCLTANSSVLPSHLCRMAALCITGDYLDPEVRHHIKSVCIPRLSQHRREILSGTYLDRHTRPEGYLSGIQERSRLIRNALHYAHQHLVPHESSNVISFFRFRKELSTDN